jgi:hypothetical protein
MADLPTIPLRRPQPNVYTSLLVAAALLLVAGSVWMALKNQDQTTVDNRQGGPFEYLAK